MKELKRKKYIIEDNQITQSTHMYSNLHIVEFSNVNNKWSIMRENIEGYIKNE